ncbi:hypothetical protein SDC9_191863 [bioreactor metagenome]|uniref:Uncharacterized protein n=1 Tax=bioreactor metagenome TaxID=1076179 RepID=A0A645HZ23_9ZZZZ
MTADIGEAMFLGNGSDSADHRSLHAAQVYHYGGLCNFFRVGLHPFHRRAGTDGGQNQIALRELFVCQRPVDGAAETSQSHGLGVRVQPPYHVSRASLHAFCHGAADEAKANDSNVHRFSPPG